MGIRITMTLEDNKPVLHIPEKSIPKHLRRPQPIRLPQRQEYETTAYIYGGGGVKITPEGIKIPRTGVSGPIPEIGIPTDLVITHVFKDGRWITVEEKPVLTPIRWSPRRWRASIPVSIRYKYRIVPGTKVRMMYTEYVTRFVVPKLKIHHLSKEYYADWDEENRWMTWYVPEDTPCYDTLALALKERIYAGAECHFEETHVNIDFIFSAFGGKYISRKTGYAFRNMAVRNYTATVEIDYPLLVEIRAFYLTSCPKEFYQDEKRYIPLLDALRITVQNIVYFFTQSIRHAEKEGKVTYETTPISIEEMEVEVLGEEENVEVDYAEADPFPFYKAVKYVRIINEQTYKRRKGKPYIYHDVDIEEELKIHPLVEIKDGFIWMR